MVTLLRFAHDCIVAQCIEQPNNDTVKNYAKEILTT